MTEPASAEAFSRTPAKLDLTHPGPTKPGRCPGTHHDGSGLDFVIARPTRLTQGPVKGTYVRTADLIAVPESIARADVADFTVDVCESATWMSKGVQLGG